MPRQNLIRDSFGFAVAQYLVRATLMLRGLISARLLGPEAFGAWNALQILMDYGSFASAGTQQGLDQMVPSRLVAGDTEGAGRVKRAALANIVTLTLLFAIGCLLWVTTRSSRVLQAWGVAGILIALGCVVAVNIAYYLLSILRSHDRMDAVSQWYMLQSVVGALLGLALIPWFGMWGLLVGWFAGCMVSLVNVARDARSVAPLVPRFAVESIRVVTLGFPMFVHSASSLVMRSLDRIIILRYLGTESLGHYSLSVMALTLLLYLPDSIAYVIYPRLLKLFSSLGDDPEAIGDRVRRVLQVMAVLVPLLSGLGYLWSREVVAMVLPRYLPGVSAMRIMCFGAAGLALTNLSSIVLMTVGRRLWLVPAAMFSVALAASLQLYAVQTGHGMTGVAVGTAIAFVTSGSLMLTLALRSTGSSWVGILVTGARILAPLPIALVLAWACDRFMPWSGGSGMPIRVLRLVVGSLAFVSVYAVLVSSLARGAGLQAIVAEMDPPVIAPVLRRLGWLGVKVRENPPR